MVSQEQSGRSRKLAYLGLSLAAGAALAAAGFVVATDSADTQAMPGQEMSPRDAAAKAAAVRPEQPRFKPQIPAELLVAPQSVTSKLASLSADPPPLRSETTGSVAPTASPSAVIPTPKKRPVEAARSIERRPVDAPSAQIARIKSALKLTPAQERYWPPVEAALRDIVEQMSREATSGTTRSRAGASVDPDRIQRLTSAAMPLLMTFDEAQRREVRRIARNMGLEDVAAAI
jgi:hypothetical protein